MNKKDKEYTSTKKLWVTLSTAGLAVLAVWLLSWLLVDYLISSPTDRGAFGDKFGAVNALFSGLAFAGLIVTLLYQKEELKLQREELAETRKELNAQRLEFEEQNKTLRRQRFENTLFNMLSLQQEIVANLSYEYYADVNIRPNDIPEDVFYNGSPKVKLRGREIFDGIYNHAFIDCRGVRITHGIKGVLKIFGAEVYSHLSETSRFDHYFRHLCSIYEFINYSDLISEEDRSEYARIVRSQLSDCELVMLFYACLTIEGYEIFKCLIEKYQVFKDLRINLLADPAHKDKYSINAYVRY